MSKADRQLESAVNSFRSKLHSTKQWKQKYHRPRLWVRGKKPSKMTEREVKSEQVRFEMVCDDIRAGKPNSDIGWRLIVAKSGECRILLRELSYEQIDAVRHWLKEGDLDIEAWELQLELF